MAAGAFALRVCQFQPRAEGVDELNCVRARGLSSLLRRHLAEVQLIQRILPNLQRAPIGEIRSERVETNFVLLLVRPVALDAVRPQKRFQRIQHLISTRLAKRQENESQRGQAELPSVVADSQARPSKPSVSGKF